MRTFDCDKCGDTIVVAEKGETVTEGETALEHLDRTGHSWKRDPRLTGCADCGFVWWYTGSADRATCPSCKSKSKPGHIPAEIDQAYAKAEDSSSL